MGDQNVRALWERAAESYDVEVPYFRLMGERIVTYADLHRGQHVLDLACGNGACLLPAASAVELAGFAVGVDVTEAMVRSAARRAAEADLRNVSTLIGDAQTLPFAAERFDRITCAFGLGFFGGRGLREMSRVLRTDGRVVATIRAHRGPGWEFFDELCQEFGLTNAAYPGGRVAFQDKVDADFERAGLSRPAWALDHVDVTFSGAESWWRWMWSHGERGYLERLSDDQLELFRLAAFERLTALTTDDGISLRRHFHVLVATSASS